MKDPAVLFYFQDFLVGTEFFTDDETGKYIRILCHQADKGSLTLAQLEKICNGKVPSSIMDKLKSDGDDKYYQGRMRIEREKRIAYSESRRKNREVKDDKICKTYDKHMENEDENENDNRSKNIEIRETLFVSEVWQYKEQYSETMLKAFINYWTEKNKSRTKMLWETKKTFEIPKRLVTWASRDKNSFDKEETPKLKIITGTYSK